MSFSKIVSAHDLFENINNPNWIVFDCRFSLANENYGASSYKKGHIPNAYYVDLNKDLSSEIRDYTGRHPLPDFTTLVKKLSNWGVSGSKQVVVYDDACTGFSARMWWLLKIMGHENVAVLDGGFSNWGRHSLPITTVLPNKTQSSSFRSYLDSSQWLNPLEIQNGLARNEILLIDARTKERFNGSHEPIDPVAGHIPKAINRPFGQNFDSNGLFLPRSVLFEQFAELTRSFESKNVVHMCGSGVTAICNLLAMEIADLEGSKLYAGSWSEWIVDKNRAISTC